AAPPRQRGLAEAERRALQAEIAVKRGSQRMSDDVIVFEVSYDQGDEGGPMDFLLIVVNGVDGALVSFKAEEPNPAGAPIVLLPTPVTFSPMTAGMRTTVDAGYRSQIRIVYDPNG